MNNLLNYKGYSAKIEFDNDDKILFGKIIGVKDSITFQGSSIFELEADFKKAVDHYLNYCFENNEEPQKPYSGKILLRLTPEIHAKIALQAELKGMSINNYAKAALEMAS